MVDPINLEIDTELNSSLLQTQEAQAKEPLKKKSNKKEVAINFLDLMITLMQRAVTVNGETTQIQSTQLAQNSTDQNQQIRVEASFQFTNINDLLHAEAQKAEDDYLSTHHVGDFSHYETEELGGKFYKQVAVTLTADDVQNGGWAAYNAVITAGPSTADLTNAQAADSQTSSLSSVASATLGVQHQQASTLETQLSTGTSTISQFLSQDNSFVNMAQGLTQTANHI